MAEKRMLSKKFVNNARFMQMSNSAKLLYVYLNIHADDDGIVEVYAYSQMLHTPEDDVKLLAQKEFIVFINDDWLAFLPHWTQNQSIRTDRFTPSIYRNLLLNKYPDFYSKLKHISLDRLVNSNQTEILNEKLLLEWYPECQPDDNQRDTQIRLGQNRTDKTRIDKTRIDKISIDKGSLEQISISAPNPFKVATKTSFLDPKAIETIAYYQTNQSDEYKADIVKVICQTKNSVEKKYKTFVESTQHTERFHQMLDIMFKHIQEKNLEGIMINELAYINKTTTNFWTELILEKQKMKENDTLAFSDFINNYPSNRQ